MLLTVVVILLLVIWLLSKPFYWKVRGVPSYLPLPIIGNCLPAVYLSNKGFFDTIYYQFPEAPYVGMHLLTRPALFLKDPKIIHEVFEEKANYFASRGLYTSIERDAIADSLFHKASYEWKSLRAKLSPCFRPSKIKSMLQVGRKSLDKLMDEVSSKEGEEFDAHSTFTFLTIDFTAATMFGLETPIFKDRTNSFFYKSAKDLNTPISMMKMLLSMVSPVIYDFFKLVTFTRDVNAFFTSMTMSSKKSSFLNQRKNDNVMDSLLELVPIDKLDCTDSKEFQFLRSQSTLFYSGGVETTAVSLSFTLHELAKNLELQRDLRKKLSTEEGDALLKSIIKESLRKHPVFSVLSRSCTQRCKLSTGLEVEPGTPIIIPVLSIHADPKHFPSPEEFIPGRKMPKGAYLAFGAGPMTCIGNRSAMALMEETLTTLLKKYEFTTGSAQMKVAPKTFLNSPKNGVWLKVRALADDAKA